MYLHYLHWIKSPFYLPDKWLLGLLLTFLFTVANRKDNDRFIAGVPSSISHSFRTLTKRKAVVQISDHSDRSLILGLIFTFIRQISLL